MKCQRCGDCCQSGTLLKQCSKEEKKIFKLLYAMLGEDINKKICPYLDFKMGLAICKIYDERPQFCKDYFCDKCK